MLVRGLKTKALEGGYKKRKLLNSLILVAHTFSVSKSGNKNTNSGREHTCWLFSLDVYLQIN